MSKKKLLVKEEEVLNNSMVAEVEPLSIPEPVKKADKRGKGEHVMSNLEKGREKLQIIWAEKRKEKEALAEKALQKKMNLKEKQKQKIMEEYGVDSLSSDDEVQAPPVEVKKVKKMVAVAPVIVEKKPAKKKIIRYVEEEEASSEEEIVYVKREKKDRYVAPPEPPSPTLIFY